MQSHPVSGEPGGELHPPRLTTADRSGAASKLGESGEPVRIFATVGEPVGQHSESDALTNADQSPLASQGGWITPPGSPTIGFEQSASHHCNYCHPRPVTGGEPVRQVTTLANADRSWAASQLGKRENVTTLANADRSRPASQLGKREKVTTLANADRSRPASQIGKREKATTLVNADRSRPASQLGKRRKSYNYHQCRPVTGGEPARQERKSYNLHQRC